MERGGVNFTLSDLPGNKEQSDIYIYMGVLYMEINIKSQDTTGYKKGNIYLTNCVW